MLYIGGLGRSGSTLVERLTGQLPGACAVGELVHLWQRGITEGERCGCGQPFRQCPFWQQAGKAAFGGWDEIDTRPHRRPPRPGGPEPVHPAAGRPVGRAGPGPALDEYTSYYARLYAAIAEVSGCELMVDSSKHPSLAHCLRRQDGVDLRVLHLVRDSRAVAYSWGRAVRRPDTDRESYMTRYSPAVAAAQWNGQNAAFHLLRGMPVMRLRYEDVVAAPEAALRRIAEFSGLPAQAASRSSGPTGRNWSPGTACRGTRCGSPPGRSRSGGTSGGGPACRPGQRREVTALTFPLLAAYGYLGGRP